MAFKKQGTTAGTETKKYFWLAHYLGNGMSKWMYITTDTPAVCEVSGYFDDTEIETVVKPGDELEIIQVAALGDTRTIQDDIAAGFADNSLHKVVASDGSGINISPDLRAATLTYTS